MGGAATGEGMQALYGLIEVLLVFIAPVGVLIVVLAVLREIGGSR